MSSDELKDIDFGEINNIELNTNWPPDPLFNLTLMKLVNFPQEIQIKVHYDHYIQTWTCFQTEEWIKKNNTEKLKSYENLVKLWRSTPIQTVQVTPTQENWVKEISGLKFCIASLQYLEGVDK